jgi:hypothetical protein
MKRLVWLTARPRQHERTSHNPGWLVGRSTRQTIGLNSVAECAAHLQLFIDRPTPATLVSCRIAHLVERRAKAGQLFLADARSRFCSNQT